MMKNIHQYIREGNAMTDEIMSDDHVAASAVTFDKFGFEKAINKSIKNEGFVTPTPIQEMAMLPVMSGLDLMGIAQTGSGKTAAFSLPTINKMIPDYVKPSPHKPKALILAPTRELVMQIGKFIDQFSRGTPIKSLVVAGGQPYPPQIRKLKYGVDILISTPGRLIDHMGSGNVKLGECKTFILDEADRMLDMGFIDEVKEIQSTLDDGHQTVMFSATMNEKVRRLSRELLKDPEYVEQERKTMVADTITHKLMNVRRKNKTDLLIELLEDETIDKALIFARTKIGADKLCDELKEAFRDTPMRIDAIHGDKKQRTREKILLNYRKGRTKVLVATDVAARGIDVDGITHVINYELPIEAENYVHRVGRTGRAGQLGLAISFCDPSDIRLLREIENLIKIKVEIDADHEYHFDASEVRTNKKGRGARSPRPKNKFDKSRGRTSKPSEGRSAKPSDGRRPRRSEGGERTERTERKDRNDRNERGDRKDRNERYDRSERGDRKDRNERQDRSERVDRNDRPKRRDGARGSLRTELPARADRPRGEKRKKPEGKRYNPAKFDPLDTSFGFDDDPVLQKLQGQAKRKKKSDDKSADGVVAKKKKTTKRDHFDDKAAPLKKKTLSKAAPKKSKGKPSRADRKKIKQTGGHKAFSPKRG